MCLSRSLDIKTFSLFGSTLKALVLPYKGGAKKESALYTLMKDKAEKLCWTFVRVETKDQQGFPDMLLLKGPSFWLIEAKKLYKKNLYSIKDDLHWQYGQLGFLATAVTQKMPYCLLVGAKDHILYICHEDVTPIFADTFLSKEKR